MTSPTLTLEINHYKLIYRVPITKQEAAFFEKASLIYQLFLHPDQDRVCWDLLFGGSEAFRGANHNCSKNSWTTPSPCEHGPLFSSNFPPLWSFRMTRLEVGLFLTSPIELQSDSEKFQHFFADPQALIS
jgi:hypothetical protein